MQNKLKHILATVAFAATIISLFASNDASAEPLPGSLNVSGLYSFMPKSSPVMRKDCPKSSAKQDTTSPVSGQQLNYKPTN
jgi:hypothetical protein